MPAPDVLVVGRYRLVKRLADGGMGSVWEGWDERLLRPVAVKQLHPQHGRTAADAELAKNRVMREARLTARLHHPHAVPVYDVVDDDGQPCLIMQYLPSVSLQQLVRDKGVLTTAEVARIGSEIASALAEAHRAGIVHRDVKPGNVLIAEDGTAKITDFGISHAMDDITVTSTGMVSGTPAYLAPEVARGLDSTFASDVFSLGSTLYLALEGSPPFGSDPNPMAMLHRVASGRLNPSTRTGPVAALLEEMLAADPRDRPPMVDVQRRLAARATADPKADEPTGVISPATMIIDRSPATPPPMLPTGMPAVLPPGQPAFERRRGPLLPVLAVLIVIGLAVVVAIMLLGGSGGDKQAAGPTRTDKAPVTGGVRSTPSSTSRKPRRSASSSASRTSASAGAGKPRAAQLARAVDDYYALLPTNTDEGWRRLTAGYQQGTARSRQTYQQFWDGIRDVTVSDAVGSPPGGVEATVTYFFKDGRVVDERTTFQLVREAGVLKIAGTRVGNSVTR